MKEENRPDNLNTLKEMLLDERKLVTYVSLSKDLCIHVNESKSLLKEVIEEMRKKDKNIALNVNYIISGLLDGNKAQTAVCNEGELSDLRDKFKTVFFQHLYSVCPGAPSTESVAFMAVNRFEDFPLYTGLIKNNSCDKRPAEEIGHLKTNSQEITIEQKPVIGLQKKVKEANKNEKNNTSEKPVTKVQQSKSEPIVKTEISSPKRVISNSTLQNNDRKNVNKSQKGIVGFFNKATSSSTKKPLSGIIQNTKQNEQKVTVKTDKKENIIIKPEKMDVDDDMANEVHQSTKQSNNLSKIKDNQTLDSKKKTGKVESRDQIKKTAKVDKKRKRVLHVSDSESDGEKDDPFLEEPMADLESEDEIPATPSIATVKITSGIVNPRKKRRVVDKTYTDEDGYILTKKEEVYESCSDHEQQSSAKENVQNGNVKVKVEVSSNANEIEVTPKEKTVTKTRKKTASPQKGKQATLMSFFKKKV